MSRDGRRSLRVAELVRARFADVVRQKLGDPKLSALVVSDVSVSDDLSIVDIRVRFLGIEAEEERRRLMQRLRKVLPVLRRVMLAGIELRRAPELRVHHDDGQESAKRVDELLREIEEEKRRGPPG